MGLFDNLFLDANTPVTINDGMDHSKEFGSVNPSGTGGQSGGSSSGGNPGDQKDPASQKKDSTKKDDGLQDLFGKDAAEEKQAAEVLSPKPPQDIALEIGNALDNKGSDLSNIDIGGDISFDIGGDVLSDSLNNVPEPISEAETVVSSVSDITVNDSDSGVTMITSTDTTGSTGKEGLPDKVPELQKIEESSATKSPSEESLPPLESTEVNPLFSLIGSEPIQSTTTIEPGTQDPLVSTSETTTKSSDDVSKSSDLFGFSDIETPKASPVTSTELSQSSTLSEGLLKTVSESPKLKSRISQLLGQLETMEFSDESQKEYKEKQIEMYRLRIADLKAEYDMRIRALQLEIEALEGEMKRLELEVTDMENEKSRIKSVIENFQKELETAPIN